ncbi:MAG: deoxyribodipyrimidine photolyase [Candidatus Hydrogenedentota bacterium]
MSTSPAIVWFRQDLRIEDNPALATAVKRGGPIIPAYIHAPEEEGEWPTGAASKVWLHHSLSALDASLRDKHSRLIVLKGRSQDVLEGLVRDTGAGAVFWNRRYEPTIRTRDEIIKTALRDMGCDAMSFNGSLLFEPWEIETKQGDPYQVFTPFWKACLAKDDPAEPFPAPRKIPAPNDWPASLELEALRLLPGISWDQGIRKAWSMGEGAAAEQLNRFLEDAVADYDSSRDRPDIFGTSRLSPHLHFGEISPRQIWGTTQNHLAGISGKGAANGAEKFLAELGWREFSHHLLYHFPHVPNENLREQFNRFPWADDEKALRAWQKGMTGYPIVDAGMRELWTTGWMHNRVRMIVASFLTKDLLIHWLEGARWFWDTLVDADLANNTQGWQWTGGCGADAAPYFRIFNPVTQGERYDPEGDYVREWIPELANLPSKWIHKPWEASEVELSEAGITLGDTYPHPIVDHAQARERALEAYNAIKNK